MKSGMSYEEQIHEYLEGNLSKEEERQLFDRLSEHPEWRDELAFQMRMQQEMQKDITSVTIPSKTTSSIFATLGFGVPKKASASVFTKYFTNTTLQHVLVGASVLASIGTVLYFISKPISKSDSVAVSHPSSLESPSLETKPPVAEDRVSTAISTDSIKTNSSHETIKASKDLGKFSSVDYLTDSKIIGVTNGGNIFFSDDGGLLWTAQRSNTSRDLFGVHFTDSVHGVIVGAKGTILLTANSGRKWKSVGKNTDANLINVRYITRDTLFACGARGAILRSTNGGLSWQKLESGTSGSLFKIKFENGSIGSISGEHGILLQTMDGGSTWQKKK